MDSSWTAPFTAQTGCKVNAKYAGSSDEMVSLMANGGGGQYDMVSASGDADLRLIYGGDVRPMNPGLIPDWKNFQARFKAPPFNTINGVHYGISLQWGPNVLLYSQFALERNDAVDRRVKAAAWYVEPGYRFSMLPWSPQLNLRYAHFSGDPNPNDRLKQSYDPLFNTGGSRGFGCWFLGEIFGQYISANTNLNLEMAHLKFSPMDTLDFGILYYNFHFDQSAQLNNSLITSRKAAQEVDFYSLWSTTEWLTFTGVLAFAVPGPGLKQAAQTFVADNGPPNLGVGRTMMLAELFVSVKY